MQPPQISSGDWRRRRRSDGDGSQPIAVYWPHCAVWPAAVSSIHVESTINSFTKSSFTALSRRRLASSTTVYNMSCDCMASSSRCAAVCCLKLCYWLAYIKSSCTGTMGLRNPDLCSYTTQMFLSRSSKSSSWIFTFIQSREIGRILWIAYIAGAELQPV